MRCGRFVDGEGGGRVLEGGVWHLLCVGCAVGVLGGRLVRCGGSGKVVMGCNRSDIDGFSAGRRVVSRDRVETPSSLCAGAPPSTAACGAASRSPCLRNRLLCPVITARAGTCDRSWAMPGRAVEWCQRLRSNELARPSPGLAPNAPPDMVRGSNVSKKKNLGPQPAGGESFFNETAQDWWAVP